MKLKSKFLILTLVLLFIPEFLEAQCSMCRAVLESDADKSTAKGINNGIVFLMAFPYLLVGGLGYYIYKNYSSKK
ncbi:MAG: hypothetical protein LAT51_01210 [Flavobacteriaceae bacterium]|nr:hypothetical protein [Flavobacteriaceae bacterium]